MSKLEYNIYPNIKDFDDEDILNLKKSLIKYHQQIVLLLKFLRYSLDNNSFGGTLILEIFPQGDPVLLSFWVEDLQSYRGNIKEVVTEDKIGEFTIHYDFNIRENITIVNEREIKSCQP